MSTEPRPLPPPCPRPLGEYVAALIDRLGAASPAALARVCALAAGHRARLRLDGESIEVAFRGGRLEVTDDGAAPVDGSGFTDRATTFALLDGRVEAYEALLDGSVGAVGTTAAVTAMFRSIEILLDESTRSPALQALAREYQLLSPAAGAAPDARHRGGRRLMLRDVSDAELALLARLDLLP